MRLLLLSCCAVLAGCSPPSGTGGNATGSPNDIAASNSAGGNNDLAKAAAPLSDNASLRERLYALPESNLQTECAVADAFPGRRVPPGFYANLPQPAFDRYLECLLREARRDGGRVRLAGPGSFPTVGTCMATRIGRIGTRFHEGPPGRLDGTTVLFANGIRLVDYGLVGPVARSRVGDPVRVCVHALPQDCPGYDLRGIDYRVRNLRSGERWVMGNSQHLCRGA